MNATFSSLHRHERLRQLSSDVFDLLVIGGGITGAGIALDAATRGIKTALIEKNDFAFGTSSRSTKLVHGGLRYLKQLEFFLVHETGTERAILHRNAPHLVVPENMLLPIIVGSSLGKYSTSVGLWLYDILAGVKKEERRKMLSKEETLHAEPLLRKDIIIGGGLYKEYRTDDARLTIEVLKTAARYGAVCLNYVKAEGFVYESGKIAAVKGVDQWAGHRFNIRARQVVNAAGPWVDEVRSADHRLQGKKLHLTKGIHIVVPYERMPLKQSVYFDVADGRMMFAIPREEITYIGTTDTTYTGDLDFPYATADDVRYVLAAANAMFPSIQLSSNDILSTWAGLRPLIYEEHKAPSELSRKDEIFFSSSGLISIAGGKLTGFRKMAERVVDVVAQQLSRQLQHRPGKCQTESLILSGGDFGFYDKDGVNVYKQRLIKETAHIGLEIQHITALVDRYGTHASMILNQMHQYEAVSADVGNRLLMAELDYGIRQEMVMNLSDFLIRRTGRLYFERPRLLRVYRFLSPYIAKQLRWTPEEAGRQEEAFMREYEAVMRFKKEMSPENEHPLSLSGRGPS